MIKAWKHPIKYLRLVTTPTCDKCRNYIAPKRSNGYRVCCTCERYLEHTNRLEGTECTKALAHNVRSTRWCRFEPEQTEEERLDELFGEIDGRFEGADE